MCLGFHPEQLRPEAFWLRWQKKNFPMLPTCRITKRLTGIESLGWRLFADGCKKRNINGTEMGQLGCPIVSSENFVWVMCGPVVCDARLLAFLGATSCINNTTELSGFAEAIRWAKFFILRGARLRILFV